MIRSPIGMCYLARTDWSTTESSARLLHRYVGGGGDPVSPDQSGAQQVIPALTFTLRTPCPRAGSPCCRRESARWAVPAGPSRRPARGPSVLTADALPGEPGRAAVVASGQRRGRQADGGWPDTSGCLLG